MYLRRCYRRKDGKRHTYWALVESYRTARGRGRSRGRLQVDAHAALATVNAGADRQIGDGLHRGRVKQNRTMDSREREEIVGSGRILLVGERVQRVARHAPRRDAVRRQLAVHPDNQQVLRAQLARDLELERQVAAFVTAKRFPVKPDPALGPKTGRRLESRLIPRRAAVVAQVFELVVPTRGHRDRPRAAKPVRPARPPASVAFDSTPTGSYDCSVRYSMRTRPAPCPYAIDY